MATEKEATETTPTETTEPQQQETKDVAETNGVVGEEAGKEVEKGDGDAQEDAEAPEGKQNTSIILTTPKLHIIKCLC